MKVMSTVERMDGRRLDSRRHGAVQSPLKRRSNNKKFDLRDKLNRSQSSLDEQVLRVEPRIPKEMETDPVVLERRTKDIQLGKNTQDYMKYRSQTAKESRLPSMPQTPNKYQKISRRRWDGIIKSWKLRIHRVVGSAPVKIEPTTSIAAESLQQQPPNNHMEDWAHEMDLEESRRLRSRASSCTSSDFGFCSTGVVTPRTVSGCRSPEEEDAEAADAIHVKIEDCDESPIDYIDC